ncbi:MAG: O-antigen ligase family protein [Phycisphaerales bacterium]
MLILIALLIVSTVLPQHTWQALRVSVGVPVGLTEGLILLGLIRAMFPSRKRAEWAMPAQHPLLTAILCIYLVAAPLAFAMGVLSHNPMYRVVSTARDFILLPLTMFITYRLIHTPGQLKTLLKVAVLCAIVGGFFLLFSVVALGQKVQAVESVTELREGNQFTAAINVASPLGVTFLFFALMRDRIRLLPRKWAYALATYCLLIVLFTFYRSSWVACAFSAFCLIFILPLGSRFERTFRAGIVVMIAGIFLYMSIMVVGMLVHHDLIGPINNRLLTLVPGIHSGEETHAWDTRTGSIQAELGIWSQYPLTGMGFGYWANPRLPDIGGYGHNVFTSELATGGPLCLAAVLLAVVGPWVVSKRLIQTAATPATLFTGVYGFVNQATMFALMGATASVNGIIGAVICGIVGGMILRSREIALIEAHRAGIGPHSTYQANAALPADF